MLKLDEFDMPPCFRSDWQRHSFEGGGDVHDSAVCGLKLSLFNGVVYHADKNAFSGSMVVSCTSRLGALFDGSALVVGSASDCYTYPSFHFKGRPSAICAGSDCWEFERIEAESDAIDFVSDYELSGPRGMCEEEFVVSVSPGDGLARLRSLYVCRFSDEYIRSVVFTDFRADCDEHADEEGGKYYRCGVSFVPVYADPAEACELLRRFAIASIFRRGGGFSLLFCAPFKDRVDAVIEFSEDDLQGHSRFVLPKDYAESAVAGALFTEDVVKSYFRNWCDGDACDVDVELHGRRLLGDCVDGVVDVYWGSVKHSELLDALRKRLG